jgi:hypothetical protein
MYRMNSPQERKQFRESLFRFWTLEDKRSRDLRTRMKIIGTILMHLGSTLKNCPILPAIPEFVESILPTVEDERLRTHIHEAMEDAEQFGEVLYAVGSVLEGNCTKITLRSWIPGSAYMLKAVFLKNPFTHGVHELDDRTIELLFGNEALTFATIFAKYASIPVTNVYPTITRRSGTLEEGIFSGPSGKIDTAIDEMLENNLLISRSYEGEAEFRISPSIAQNPTLLRLFGSVLVDTKGTESFFSKSPSQLNALSVTHTRSKPKQPLRETNFVQKKADEFESTVNMAASGLCNLRDKKAVIDNLETNGFRTDGEKVDRSQIKKLLYRAKRLTTLYGSSRNEMGPVGGVTE